LEPRFDFAVPFIAHMDMGALLRDAPVLGAMNVDVKAFSEAFYKQVCRARLRPVLDTCELAREVGIFVELTYLVIPDLNDGDGEIGAFCGWVRDRMGADTPVHFSRFHPDFKMMDRGRTPRSTMKRACDIARAAGLEHVYAGNIHQPEDEMTRCASCGTVLVDRSGFSSRLRFGPDGRCPKCGSAVPFIL